MCYLDSAAKKLDDIERTLITLQEVLQDAQADKESLESTIDSLLSDLETFWALRRSVLIGEHPAESEGSLFKIAGKLERNVEKIRQMPIDRQFTDLRPLGKTVARQTRTYLDKYRTVILPLERAPLTPSLNSMPPFPSANQLKRMIDEWENRHWDFKARQSLPPYPPPAEPEKDPRLELARDIASFANNENGGYLVFGVVNKSRHRKTVQLVEPLQDFRIDDRTKVELSNIVRGKIAPGVRYDVGVVVVEGKAGSFRFAVLGEELTCSTSRQEEFLGQVLGRNLLLRRQVNLYGNRQIRKVVANQWPDVLPLKATQPATECGNRKPLHVLLLVILAYPLQPSGDSFEVSHVPPMAFRREEEEPGLAVCVLERVRFVG